MNEALRILLDTPVNALAFGVLLILAATAIYILCCGLSAVIQSLFGETSSSYEPGDPEPGDYDPREWEIAETTRIPDSLSPEFQAELEAWVEAGLLRRKTAPVPPIPPQPKPMTTNHGSPL